MNKHSEEAEQESICYKCFMKWTCKMFEYAKDLQMTHCKNFVSAEEHIEELERQGRI